MDGISNYVLSFGSTHLAMAADCALGGAGVSFTMLPTPRQISAGCGIALRLAPDALERALACLAAQDPAIPAHSYAVCADGSYMAC